MAVAEHVPTLTVYDIVCVPIPAVLGLKLPPLTLVPEYAPPMGFPLVSITNPDLTQTSKKESKLAVGATVTSNRMVSKSRQPLASKPITI